MVIIDAEDFEPSVPVPVTTAIISDKWEGEDEDEPVKVSCNSIVMILVASISTNLVEPCSEKEFSQCTFLFLLQFLQLSLDYHVSSFAKKFLLLN